MPPPLVQLSGITKRFPPGIVANDGISLDIAAGEIHALLGENGAGKSTLMQILYGVYRKDAGEIRIEGEPCEFETPGDAIRRGIGMIHQEFMLVRSFTVAENIAMGTDSTGGAYDLAAVARRIRDVADEFGLDVDPRARVEHLPLGVQQRVEILKLLYRETRLLILDEPTSVLTPQEVGRLFDVLRALKAAGKSIIIVTHKLREVIDIADRVTVLRDGRAIATLPIAEVDELSLARLMVGRDVLLHVEKTPQASGPALLRVEDLSVVDDAGEPQVKNVSLAVNAGEILGDRGSRRQRPIRADRMPVRLASCHRRTGAIRRMRHHPADAGGTPPGPHRLSSGRPPARRVGRRIVARRQCRPRRAAAICILGRQVA